MPQNALTFAQIAIPIDDRRSSMIALALLLHLSLSLSLSVALALSLLLTPNSRAQLARTSNTYWRFPHEREIKREGEGRGNAACNAAFYKAHSQHFTMSEDQRSPRHPKQEQSPLLFLFPFPSQFQPCVPLAIGYVQKFNYEIRFGATRNIFGVLCSICYKMWPNEFSCPSRNVLDILYIYILQRDPH